MRGSPRSPPKRLRSPSETRLSTGTRSVSAGWGGGGGGGRRRRRGGGPTHLPSRLPGLGESEQEPPPPHPSATRAAAAPSARASPLQADRGRGRKAKGSERGRRRLLSPGRLPLRPRRHQRSFLSAIPGAAGRGAETKRDRTPVQKGSETKEAAGEGEVFPLEAGVEHRFL
ncbi:Hypothetical predicted protein [Podarcis lilfordi]|uniref:Uncharacterized protein n=1 Tax=Podarcis lilfordi TaxID=74358 RepID=A0AA35L0K6_9SAUR|nr:Hypothetical predicted protein [Podarcis lilfordi]